MTKEEMLNSIQNADRQYYTDPATCTLTDAEYDKIRYDYESQFGKLDYVPSDVLPGGIGFKHPFPVVSLDKVKSGDKDSMRKWVVNFWKKFGEHQDMMHPWLLQKKFDGLTIVIYPKLGIAVTRGDGEHGNVLPYFPKKYSKTPDCKWPIRAEALLTKSAFEKINADLVAQGKEPFKNIRNAAAGIMSAAAKARHPYMDEIRLYAYDLMGCPLSPEEKIEYLKAHCDCEVAENFFCDNAAKMFEKPQALFDQFMQEDEPVDGVVIKSNIRDGIAVYGMTGHHPLDSFAWKAFQDGEETILRDITWQVGRTQITAVATFDPVEIDGTTVTNASVSNIGIIRKLGLSIGAKILVNKANQIIPQIVQVLKAGDTPITAPTECPCCHQPLSMENDVLFCTNDSCWGRLIQNVDYLASKKVLDIKGLSESTIYKLHDADKLNTVYDLFRQNQHDFEDLDGFGEKSAKNVYDSIQNATKNVDLAHYVAASCVVGIGITVGTLLMDKYVTYDALLAAIEDGSHDFSEIEGIGGVMNTMLHSGEFIQNFMALHEFITPIEKKPVALPANAKAYTFVITGKLSQSRSYFENLIKAAGSKVAGSVSKNTDYLLCEDSNSQSTKAKKARSLGVTVISEDELDTILSNSTESDAALKEEVVVSTSEETSEKAPAITEPSTTPVPEPIKVLPDAPIPTKESKDSSSTDNIIIDDSGQVSLF